MIAQFFDPGFTARFGKTTFTNLLYNAGEGNTDRSRIGSTPITNNASADQYRDAGKSKNLSPAYKDAATGSAGTGPSLEGPTQQPDYDNEARALLGKTEHYDPAQPHYQDQWMGKSLRGPMAVEQKTSKNIFFKFRDQDAPEIWMYINPSSLVITHTKRIQEQITRGGFVLFHWGDNLDEISSSGVCGSFARTNVKGANNDVGKYTKPKQDIGLDRRDTWPYYRFMQLLALYRNNGIGDYTTTGMKETGNIPNSSKALVSAQSTIRSEDLHINKKGVDNDMKSSGMPSSASAKAEAPYFAPIEMHYDGNIFSGYFERFIWTERADQPFTFNFDFTFKVLNTKYNRVFEAVYGKISPEDTELDDSLLANFQMNSL